MNLFALNLVIALGWAAVSGGFTGTNLLLGFAGGFFALYLTRPLFGTEPPYFRRTFGAIGLIAFFVYDLVRSSLAVVWDVCTPEIHARPRMIEVPLDCKDDTAIMLTANLISLTPGSLSVDVSPDRSTLLIHAMFAEEPDEVVRDLKRGIERRVMEALR
jgi:multicomponent Na+:H+ antiporter subunit E